MQLQLYMHALGIKDGVLLYLEKNTLKTKTFNVGFEQVIAEEALYRFKKLHEHLKKNELPSPEARVKNEMGWMCNRCEYRDLCFKHTPEV